MANTQALTDVQELRELQRYFEEALTEFKQIKGEIDKVLDPTLASWQDPVGQDFQTKYRNRVENIQENMQNWINPLTKYLEVQAGQLESEYLNTDL